MRNYDLIVLNIVYPDTISLQYMTSVRRYYVDTCYAKCVNRKFPHINLCTQNFNMQSMTITMEYTVSYDVYHIACKRHELVPNHYTREHNVIMYTCGT